MDKALTRQSNSFRPSAFGLHRTPLSGRRLLLALAGNSMATINDSLLEIPRIQKAISDEVETETLDDAFLNQISNTIGVYYFDLLSHACMNSISPQIKNGAYPSAFQAYNDIAEQGSAYQEVIKINNIGNLFILWAKFEQFVYRHVDASGKVAGDFQKAHRKFMESKKIKRKRIKEIEEVFIGIRRTRNSLHNDGIYHNEDGKSYTFELAGEKYTLEHDKPVKPLRTLTLVNFLIEHYYELQSNE